MANLFWRQSQKKTLNLISKPFASEQEFEEIVFSTKELLGDIFQLKRQIRGGSKSGIPDILGIDTNGDVCIIEMKNAPVDSAIIPQVLEYAIWAQQNPDSIKNLWLESKSQPDDIDPHWDSYEVRIIVIAPSIERSALGVVGKINYPVDLIEVTRWVEGKNEFLLVNELKPDRMKKSITVRGRPEYDRAFYESLFNKQSVKYFFEFIQETQRLVKAKGWPLETKFNKFYCGFKYGFFNAFFIKWMSSKTFAFGFKLPKSVAEKAQPRGIKMDKYDEGWKEAIYRIDPEKTKVKEFLHLFTAAMESVTGQQK